MNEVKLTVLVDDYNGIEKGFIRSYGFAILIEINQKKILFDVGSKVEPLLANLKTYGIELTSLDAVILSHNHDDHTDGLPGILRAKEDIPIYIHKDWDAPARFKGFQVPRENRVVVQKAREYSELSHGIFFTDSFWAPDYGGIHEHACYIEANDSYILLCGCCHPGLNKFLEDRKILGIPENNPLHIIGGMHGFRFSNEDAKKYYPVIRSIVLCHCTIKTTTFQRQFGEKCSKDKVGKSLIFS